MSKPDHPKFTSSTHRNSLVAWVSISHEGRDVANIHLPSDISDEDLATAERHALSLFNTAFHFGYTLGEKRIKTGIRNLLGV